MRKQNRELREGGYFQIDITYPSLVVLLEARNTDGASSLAHLIPRPPSFTSSVA